MKIVTRFVNHMDSKMDEYGIEYVGVYFHKVDLKENKIVKKCYPPMWNSLCTGSILEVGAPCNSRIYILCGTDRLPDDDEDEDEDEDEEEEEEEEEEKTSPVPQLDGRHCYLGSSFLDLNGKLMMWKHGPLIPDVISGKCVDLYGDIYSFGNLYLSPMVLKQGDEAWKELPKNWPHEISECEVSSPVVSDPANSRILVHLYPSYLCAFYPFECNAQGIQGGRWDIMCTHFIGRRWGNAVTLAAADGMLYTHDSYKGGHGRGTFLHAYHLPTDEFFHVSWSSLNILAADGDYAHLHDLAFDSLFYDDDAGDLWFAAWSPSFDSDPSYVIFFNFKAEVNVKAQQVVCTPVRLLSFDMDPGSRVTDFIQIHHDEEACERS